MAVIYKISSKSTGQCYVGSTVRYKSRITKHQKELRAKKHHSYKLQEHCNKFGFGDLEFSIIECVRYEELEAKERYYIDLFDSFNCGFNCTVITKRQTLTDSKISHIKSLETRVTNLMEVVKTKPEIVPLIVLQTIVPDSSNYKACLNSAINILEHFSKLKPSTNPQKKISKKKTIVVFKSNTGKFYSSLCEQIKSDLDIVKLVMKD
jgi:group I intron endonuclease